MDLANDIFVTIGGDFCPVGRPQVGLLDGSLTAEDIVGSMRALFAESDFGIVNLECPLSESGKPITKTGPHICADPRMIRLLRSMGVAGVTLANNHVRDFDSAGVTDTLALCSANGIRTVGAGATLEDARRPLFVPVKGRRLAFINAGEREFGCATRDRAGGNPLDLINLLRDLRQARSQADHVILIIHGGLELTHIPSPESVRMLRFLAEQGVTAVIRHHSHYVQGYEVWNGVPIFYGLGNLLFDLDERMADAWYQGLVVRLIISPDDACEVELHPISQCDASPSVNLLEGGAKAQTIRRLESYSELLADEHELSRAWMDLLNHMMDEYFGMLLVPSLTLRRIIWRLGLKRFVRPGERSTQFLGNLLRCDTHREALIDLLNKDHAR